MGLIILRRVFTIVIAKEYHLDDKLWVNVWVDYV